ncbi:unnamed protein product [Cyberlindnera jadinii]|uniref:Uncharacterized protein n=1 Tax=Cyberlindnera jadinii (strain ATCC 18201 / CBS 1600 / BCRC 20928 / JCM 3617 / NBRC 0987 / NRRL Y-1542) TaxID=983966 RepID=A0A0H5CA36_CYBJN|nr:unnamed protein product [Cyberlindnera jadinii]
MDILCTGNFILSKDMDPHFISPLELMSDGCILQRSLVPFATDLSFPRGSIVTGIQTTTIVLYFLGVQALQTRGESTPVSWPTTVDCGGRGR